VHDVDETGTFTIQAPGKHAYIAGGEARIIEFMPVNAGEIS